MLVLRNVLIESIIASKEYKSEIGPSGLLNFDNLIHGSTTTLPITSRVSSMRMALIACASGSFA